MSEAGAELVVSADSLARVIVAAARAPRLAVDVEADGLFAYRTKLCTVQLAWEEGDRIVIAIVDALAAPVAALAPLLGASGPMKVLHDLTFDAKLLAESGARIDRARDTSVTARFLGFTSTGLATLLKAELGLEHDKRFQQHDWGARPITEPQLAYLAKDVAHLFALDDALTAKALALDIEEEIAEECAYKLATSERPPRDGRPSYVRIKGSRALDSVGRAILRRLVAAREAIAESRDVPPFKVISNEALLAIAEKRPASVSAIRSMREGSRNPDVWARAVAEGIADGDVPEADAFHFKSEPVDRPAVARRRAVDERVMALRKLEAKTRGLDEQVILPGHCAQDVGGAIVAWIADGGDEAALREAFRGVPGLGRKRLARYEDAFVAIASEARG